MRNAEVREAVGEHSAVYVMSVLQFSQQTKQMHCDWGSADRGKTKITG